MDSRTRTGRATSEAEEAFAEYLDRVDGGGDVDFDAFCAEHPELADELRALRRSWEHVASVVGRLGLKASADGAAPATIARELDPGITLQPDSGDEGEDRAGLVHELALRRDETGRYRKREEISRGGMGAVLRIWDRELRRPLAMKTMLPRGIAGPSEREIGRFLEEAQITAQLDHPGVVPVHELGLDADGRLFFTMHLVRGETLGKVLRKVASGEEGWSLTRALGVVLKVCETMSFAHERGVLHRDLKPANVMVGRHGEVYVMDWGLARVLGADDRKDVRLAGEPATMVWTDRKEHARRSPDSPLVTMDGDVVGTPAYMSPEQAEGDVEHLGPPSDVYSVGAILYELLAGEMPYEEHGTPVSPHVLWRRVLSGPPRPLARTGARERGVPPELVAICERAMARDLGERYASMQEMADDLRAYLEGRVVRAHRTGPVVELQKWVHRNRAFASAAAALVLVTLVATLAYAWNERRRTAEIRVFADLGRAKGLLEEVADLGPIDTEHVPARQDWLERAEALTATLPERRRELEASRAKALSARRVHIPDPADASDDAGSDPEYDELFRLRLLVEAWTKTIARLRDRGDPIAVSMSREEDAAVIQEALERARSRITDIERGLNARQIYQFPNPEAEQDHQLLTDLVASLDALGAQSHGAITKVRREVEETTRAQELSQNEYSERWEDAIAAISTTGLYGGLELEAQFGLVPLGPDPESGLWEFWHVLSGSEPIRGKDGELLIRPETGIVLVLIPGGAYSIGASPDQSSLHYDPQAPPQEGPVTEVHLRPYLMSKYEVSQSQWLRLTGGNPSHYFIGSHWLGFGTVSPLHPVESVTWSEASKALRRIGLDLPTEAQWEVACRALSTTPFFFGNSLEQCPTVNHYDQTASRVGVPEVVFSPSGIDDGWPFHSPIDIGPVNQFGLVNMNGNVAEFCLDRFGFYDHLKPGTGENAPSTYEGRSVRGGSFRADAWALRSTSRDFKRIDASRDNIGIRPCTLLLSTKKGNQ